MLTTLLLTGIVAITVTVSGAAVVDHSIEQSAAGHVVGQVDVSANASTVEVTHLGGDDFAPETLSVVLQSESDSARVAFANGTITGVKSERFVAGATWRYDYADELDGHLQKVYVVYTPRNDVLDVERFENTSDSGTTGDGEGGDSGTARGGNSPGEAYLDLNRDGRYDNGSDVRVPVRDLENGFRNTSERLVVPADVTVHVERGRITADGILVRGAVTSDDKNAGITLDAGESALTIDGSTIETTGKKAGVDLDGATVTVRNATLATHGDSNIASLSIDAVSALSIDNATVETTGRKGGVDVVSRGTLAVRDATIRTNGDSNIAGVTVDGSGAVTLDGTTIETTGKKAGIDVSAGGSLSASNAVMTTEGMTASVTSNADGAADLGGATIETTGKKADVSVTTKGALTVANGRVSTVGMNAGIWISGGGETSISHATITTSGKKAGIGISGNPITGKNSATVRASGKNAAVWYA